MKRKERNRILNIRTGFQQSPDQNSFRNGWGIQYYKKAEIKARSRRFPAPTEDAPCGCELEGQSENYIFSCILQQDNFYPFWTPSWTSFSQWIPLLWGYLCAGAGEETGFVGQEGPGVVREGRVEKRGGGWWILGVFVLENLLSFCEYTVKRRIYLLIGAEEVLIAPQMINASRDHPVFLVLSWYCNKIIERKLPFEFSSSADRC